MRSPYLRAQRSTRRSMVGDSAWGGGEVTVIGGLRAAKARVCRTALSLHETRRLDGRRPAGALRSRADRSRIPSERTLCAIARIRPPAPLDLLRMHAPRTPATSRASRVQPAALRAASLRGPRAATEAAAIAPPH